MEKPRTGTGGYGSKLTSQQMEPRQYTVFQFWMISGVITCSFGSSLRRRLPTLTSVCINAMFVPHCSPFLTTSTAF